MTGTLPPWYTVGMSIYLDYAASSPLLPEVLEEMLPALKEFGNPDSLHEYGRRAQRYVTEARDKVASLLGVRPQEVYFTSGGTEADNWAARCLGSGAVLHSPVEHAALLASAPLRAGGHLECPVGRDGVVRADDLEGSMSENIGLVSVMGVCNETGCIQPIEALAALAHGHGALFFSDCVQAAVSLDLKKILSYADAISLSAHKIGGPKGTGALIVKKGIPLSPLLAGGEQERSLRGGTVNVAGIVGFAKALEIATVRREEFCAHTGRVRDLFEERVCAALGEKAAVDGKRRAPNISHMTFERGGDAFLSLLDLKGVACSAGAACSAHAALPSHVMRAMGRTDEEAKRGVRFSFGLETSQEDALRAADIVIACGE